MKFASFSSGIITALLGIAFAVPLTLIGAIIFEKTSPDLPAASPKDAFVSGTVDYGSRK